MTSPIAKGDVLCFEDTASVATVIDGSEADGWLALNEGRGEAYRVSDLAAQKDQATFGATPPAGSPAVDSFVTVYFSDPLAPRADRWKLDGYATTPAFGTAVIAVLTNASDPTHSCFVDADKIFAV